MSRTAQSSEPMIPGIGKGFLRRVFMAGSFLQGAIELVKDGLDWGATQIHLDTTRRGYLVYADNGVGMSAANRRAFISFNLTTARADRRQAGRHGSGTKFMLARSVRVNVWTRAADDVDSIVTFGASIDEIEVAMLERAALEVEHVPVSAKTWPRGFTTGTQLEYELEAGRSIPRGEKLARELAERLTHTVAAKVFVDGKSLPEPEIIGEKFVCEVEHPTLGRIAIELARPKRHREGDTVFFTPNDIGEAPYGNFMAAVGDVNRAYYPEILSLAELHGTISAAFLADFAVDDRTQFSERLAFDKRVRTFAAFLSELAPKIGEALGITIGKKVTEGGIDLRPIADDISNRFGGLPPLEQKPPEGPTPPPGGPKPPRGGRPPKDRKTTGIQVAVSHTDREVGEEFMLYAYLRDQALLALGLGWDDLHVKYDDALVKRLGVAEEGDGWRFKPTAVGKAAFTVYVKGRDECASTVYVEIVPRRHLHLSPKFSRVRVGERVLFEVENADRIRGGRVVWETNPRDVPISVAPDALSATVSPQISNALVEVTVSDPGDAGNLDVATISVLPKDAPRIRIQDTVFWLHQHDSPGEENAAMFAYFRPEGAKGEGHLLTVNTAHPRMLRAGERGAEHVRRVFVEEVALRYAQFAYRYLHPEEAEALEAEGAHALLRKAAEVSLAVMDALLS